MNMAIQNGNTDSLKIVLAFGQVANQSILAQIKVNLPNVISEVA
jgi:hypothetical protein